MRRRLLLLVFSTTLFALVLLGVILVSVIWTSTTAAQQPRALATAKVAAAGIEDAVEAGVSVTDEMVQGYVRDEAVLTVTLPDGRVVTSASPPSGSVYRAEAAAGEVTVVAEIPTWYIQSKLVQQTLLVVLTSLLALGVATVVAMFYARRLTQPLEDFAEVAGRIATGDRRGRHRPRLLRRAREGPDHGDEDDAEQREREQRRREHQHDEAATHLRSPSPAGSPPRGPW